MIENPERVKHFLMTGKDPDTERLHPRFFTHPVPADLYRGYIEAFLRAGEVKNHQKVARTLAGILALELIAIIEADGKEPTDELINEVGQIVFNEVDAEYSEEYPGFDLPPHPVFQAPDKHQDT